MAKSAYKQRRSAAARILSRISRSGDRFWRYEDFANLPAQAVAQSLSRLAREGAIRRVRKGIYYRPRQTVLGESIPAKSEIAKQVLRRPLHPAGLTAANILGFTTQNPGHSEFATPAHSAPDLLPGAHVYARRPSSRAHLSEKEGALLEFLRARAHSSDLSPEETCQRLLALLRQANMNRLLNAASTEPPRVRAILGALAEELHIPQQELSRLRRNLNPLSRFNFGPLRNLRSARHWQAT